MAKHPPAYQWYPEAFLAATQEWTDEEVGFYKRLLDYEWVNGDIPKDFERMSRLVTASAQRIKEALWPVVSVKFIDHPDKPGRLINLKIEEVRGIQTAYREKQIEAGKKGAEKRWADHNKGNGNPTGNPTGNPYAQTVALSLRSLSLVFKSLSSKKPTASPGSLKPKTAKDLPEDQAKQLETTLKEIAKIKQYAGFAKRGWAFVTKCLNYGIEVEQIDYAFKALLATEDVKSPWPYCFNTADSKQKNVNEAHNTKETQKLNEDKDPMGTLAKKIKMGGDLK